MERERGSERAREEEEGRSKEAKTTLWTQLCFSIKTSASNVNNDWVFAPTLLYIPTLSIYLNQGPLIFISHPVFSASLSVCSSVSLSLCLTALTAIEACWDGTHYELAYMAGSCVCVWVCVLCMSLCENEFICASFVNNSVCVAFGSIHSDFLKSDKLITARVHAFLWQCVSKQQQIMT